MPALQVDASPADPPRPQRERRRRLPAPAGAVLSLAVASAAGANSFVAEGADTGAGLGARHVAQGGTGAASSDDVYAAYFNPAGLTDREGVQFAVSRQLNATLHRVNFAGVAWRLPLPEARYGLKATVAAIYYPRIHARASGAFDESDFESLFLRYLLPGISGTFDGDIDSKTRSYRIAFGAAPAGGSNWSVGGYVERIDCQSDFCGVHASSNGFTTQSTRAVATGLGLGARWRVSPPLQLGLSVSDLHTRLTVSSVTTDAAGTRTQQARLAFPRKIAVAAAWQGSTAVTWAADYEYTRGAYGRSEIDLQMLRLGVEQRDGAWARRAGAMVPVRITSTMTGRLRAPFPFSPTLGLGWRDGPLTIDVAAYAHAVVSMHKDRASPAADLSLAVAF